MQSIGWRRLLARLRECAARLCTRTTADPIPVPPVAAQRIAAVPAPVAAPTPCFSWVLVPVVPDLDDLSWLARVRVAIDALRAVVPTARLVGSAGRVAPLHGGASTHAP